MDNGFFQLLFFAFLILASIFDGVSRRRKRRRRVEEMEREEAGGGEDGPGSGPSSFPEPARSLPDSVPARTGAPSSERETADSMVPDDLWTVLTGEARPNAGGDPPESPPVPDEVVSVEPSPGSVVWGERFPEATDELEPTSPPVATTPGSSPPVWTPAPPPATTSASPARPPRPAPAPAPSRPPARMMGGALPAMRGDAIYVELLRAGGRDSIRQAIVFAEVFGTPAALRPPRWEGGGVS